MDELGRRIWRAVVDRSAPEEVFASRTPRRCTPRGAATRERLLKGVPENARTLARASERS